MNGAMAELCAKMITPPRSNRVTTIGIIHQSFTAQKKPSSSPAIENFMNSFFIDPSLLLLDHVLAHHQHVHAATAEGAEGLARRVHDRFAPEIERGVEQHGHARRLTEGVDQPPVTRGALGVNRLEPRGAVYVGDSRDALALAVLDVNDVEHVSGGVMAVCL